MFKNIKISTKITGIILVLVAFTIVTICYISFQVNKQSLRSKQAKTLQLVAETRAEKIGEVFNSVQQSISFIAENPGLIDGGTSDDAPADEGGFGFDLSVADDSAEPEMDGFDMMDEADEGMDMPIDDETIDDDGMDMMDMPAEDEGMMMGFDLGGGNDTGNSSEALVKMANNFNYKAIHLTDANGTIKYSSDDSKGSGSAITGLDQETVSKAINKFSVSPVVDNEGNMVIYIGGPISYSSGSSGIAFVELNMSTIYKISQDTLGLGETGEVLLVEYDSANQRGLFINKRRNDPASVINKIIENMDNAYLEGVMAKSKGTSTTRDYRNEEVLASWNGIPMADWGIVAKIDTEELYGENMSLLVSYLIAGGVILLIAFLISNLFSSYLSRPLVRIKDTLTLVGQGILPGKVESRTNDEFGQMAENLNELVGTLRNTAQFAQQIGEGNFDADYRPISKDDTLGVALVDMRDNLIEAEKRDKERNWIVTGVAEIGEILRAHDNLETLGDEVIKYIISKIHAVQGAFYVTNEEEDSEEFLTMKSSFAYNRKKHLKASFKFAEGLVGQSAAEMDTVVRTEIPEDYVTITSGILGDKKPTGILIVPLITDEKVYGVLEFAGFGRFDSSQVKFVEELSLILARTVFNIKVNERTRRLLEESQTMSAELQEKQEILRQNAEEMQATQEELQKSNQKLEEQIEEVNRTQKRMQLLLENASEVITIYESNETVRYISPSVEPILGYNQQELIGKSDKDKVHPDMQEEFTGMFKKLLDNPDEQVTIQYEYQTKAGDYIWIESTGTNFMNNPAIHGLIVNSQDITERRRAEQEQRMRSKMQALSENSPDLITRIEHEAISYINPVIEEYTGNNPVNYLNKKMNETDLHESILDQWLQIVEQVNETNGKVASEMDFPSNMGDRVMQVNAIPEFDESNDLESVLVVSHDITERKLIELEIQNKNKKISESINYAKRIQNAILPNNAVINRILPNSFILYKPKDVVSGDFPWYVKIGDNIFMAAVDCTGHGVPGALLSLIGYFLLNDIVRSRKIDDPGIILDQLDEGVTTTLRQDQDDSKTKDGMDIALCKINMKTREVEYAGAHRPLYSMQSGEMVEIKGNKFAIGGGIYKNQTNFTTHKLKLKSKDSIYFCSDGFPDQFGGPDNRKFGPKRTRALITDIHEKNMKEQYKIFDTTWEEWQGDEKQTDDVLLIAIKF